MPPSEHQLIDRLSYRGAKVVLSSQAKDFSFWFVIEQDGPITKKQRRALLKLLELTVDEIDCANEIIDEAHPLAAEELITPSDCIDPNGGE